MIKLKEDNVLLKPENLEPSSDKFEILGVLNPAAIRLENGKILLYVRVIEKLKKHEDGRYFYSPRFVGKNKFKIKIDKFPKGNVIDYSDLDFTFKDETKRLTFISHLRRVILDSSGLKILSVDKKPSFFGTKDDAELGVEDPRIVRIDKNYYMTYVGLTREENVSSNLAVSKDCKKWNRLGIIFGQQDKDVVLFPEKIKGEYIALDRPEGTFQFHSPNIWIAYSKDLISWGKLDAINLKKSKSEFNRIGAGPPPLKTRKGWLLIFHGVIHSKLEGFMNDLKRKLGMDVEEGPEIYAAWSALLKYDNPKKVLKRSKKPFLIPGKNDISFEDKQVVFPTGIVEDKNGKDILLYCGSGDRFITVKKIALKDILKKMK